MLQDDVYNTFVIRLSFPSKNNDSFSSNPEKLLEALQRGDDSIKLKEVRDVAINLTELGLNNIVTKNPATCAEVFAKIMDNVHKILLGIDPVDTNSYVESKKSDFLCTRQKGIFGTTKAVFSCVEVQAK